MGWGGGTDIFDSVARILEPFLDEDEYVEEYELADDLLYTLRHELEKQDWDNNCESLYWDHPVIGVILGNDNIDEEEYDD